MTIQPVTVTVDTVRKDAVIVVDATVTVTVTVGPSLLPLALLLTVVGILMGTTTSPDGSGTITVVAPDAGFAEGFGIARVGAATGARLDVLLLFPWPP